MATTIGSKRLHTLKVARAVARPGPEPMAQNCSLTPYSNSTLSSPASSGSAPVSLKCATRSAQWPSAATYSLHQAS